MTRWIVDTVTPSTAIGPLASLDYIFITRTGRLDAPTNGGAINAAVNRLSVLVDGDVVGSNIAINLSGNLNQIVTGQTGSLFAVGQTVNMSGNQNLIENHGMAIGSMTMDGDDNRINNSGTIVSSTDGVAMFGNRFYLQNSGTITGNTLPSDTFTAAVRVNSIAGEVGWVVNDGLIRAFNTAIRGGVGADYIVNNGRIEGAIDLGGGTVVERLINTGSVFGTIQGWSSAGGVLENTGRIISTVTMSSNSDRVTNGGTIHTLTMGGGADVLINSGEITSAASGFGAFSVVRNSGDINALTMSTGNDTLINKGIVGAVNMGTGTGADRAVNSGTIVSALTGFGTGAGVLNNSGSILGTATLGNGNDVVRNSGTLRDVVLGNGNDTYLTLGAGHAEGSIDGGVGNDRLIGGDEADLLLGGGGNDTLRGGGDADVIQGGAGADTVRGDEGADVFVFASASELRTTGPFDLIRDFTRDEDVIDLSQMPGALVFNGTGAFSGGGTRSVTYSVTGTTTTVRVDADGDGVSDGSILLNKIIVLSAADFLL